MTASGTKPMYRMADRTSGLTTIRIKAYFSNFRCMKYAATRAALTSAKAHNEKMTKGRAPCTWATRSSATVRMARASHTSQ